VSREQGEKPVLERSERKDGGEEVRIEDERKAK
jgi:hypothetical protein